MNLKEKKIYLSFYDFVLKERERKNIKLVLTR